MNNLQLSTKIHNISELKQILSDKNTTNDTLIDIYRKFTTKPFKTFFDSIKTKGISITDILFSLILSRLLSVTVRAMLLCGQNPTCGIEKDTFYRLKNNENIHWRKLLYIFINRYLHIIKKYGNQSVGAVKCLIIDDSVLAKTGKKIEFIGRVFDHVTKKYPLGFKLLTLGLWDGESFNAIDFSLHSEKGKNAKRPYGMSPKELKQRYSKQRAAKTSGAKRAKELDTNKIKNALTMIKRAIKHGITVNYILADSWFVSESMIEQVRNLKNGAIHLLGMCRMDKRNYVYDKKKLNAKALLSLALKAKQDKRCRKLKSRYINLVVEYKSEPIQLFFTKYSNQKNWCLLLSTDLKLSYIKAVELYQIRWSVEVFFKESKQYLQLGKSQSNDFDAQIADTTISMITYMLLNLRKRFSSYETLGGVFRAESELIRELNLWQRLWGLFQELLHELVELLEIDIEKTMQKLVREKQDQNKIILILQRLKETSDLPNVA